MPNRDPRDYLPDVADGLTHRERVVLWCLKEYSRSVVDMFQPVCFMEVR
jgi:hypothetical protein